MMIFRLGLIIVILIWAIVFVVGIIINIFKTYIRYRNIKKGILLELEIINKYNYDCKDKVNKIISKNHLIR